MAVLKCKMCGGTLSFEEGASVCECEYCGSRQTLPKQDDEKKMKLFDRANRLRFNCEFDKAAAVYEDIVAEFPEEAEAYWGSILCKYGIEYVDDPSGAKVPTCHRSSFDCVLQDPDFDMVMENADGLSRAVYREQAKAIEEIRKGIIEVSGKEQPYDIFICYKETDENGGRTLDSVLAQDVYEALTAKGYRVFFSRITLEDKLGTEYEPYIFAALNSAKVMLAFGTSYDYYNAVWVKNEWSRYIKLMAADKSKHLIPCYKDIDAYDIPMEFARLQAQDMGKVGAVQDLLRGIDKLTGRGEQAQAQQTAAVQTGSNAEKLMKRVNLFLEDKNWEQAAAYIEKALDEDAEYAPAYVGKVLVKHKLISVAALKELRTSIDNDADWQKALRFADDSQKAEYESIAKNINEKEAYVIAREERKAREKKEQEKLAVKQSRYDAALKVKSEKNYVAAIGAFKEIIGFRDSGEKLAECIDEFRKQLIERQDDAKLAELKRNAEQASKAVQSARTAVEETDKEKANAVKRKQDIPAEISRSREELAQVRGLFSGGRKRELEHRIEALTQEQERAERVLAGYDGRSACAKADLRKAEDQLRKAEDQLLKAKEELYRASEERWPEAEVIKAAMIDAARQPGKYVTFGAYEQDNNKNNGKEAIEWLVLTRNGNKALVLSRYGLDAKPYNKDRVDITWEKCTLRTWLNGEFYNTAFTAAEQARIQLTSVDNSKAQGYWSTYGGNDTQDRVFLLSYAEANKYLGVTYDNSSNTASRVSSTAYAKANGAYGGLWWLRSPGSSQDFASYVLRDGSLSSLSVTSVHEVVRPALWVEIS